MELIVNGETRETPEGISVSRLIELLEFKGRFFAVELNRELVPHDRHAATTLHEGDQVEIVTLVGGG
jgi:thiamine biosynthesis protein ThiS